MKNKYDVIIIGSGIAGTKLALELAQSGLEILVAEKFSSLGIKACGHGITRGDLDVFDREEINYPLSKLEMNYGRSELSFPFSGRGAIISSIDRVKYLNNCIDTLRQYPNIEIIMEAKVKIADKKTVLINGQSVEYQYLVGADGSNSIVRKYLGLGNNRIAYGMTYLIPQTYDRFSIYLDRRIFGSGYAWIFPNKRFTSVGCGGSRKSISGSLLRSNFEKWLKEKNIDISQGQFQAATLNYDYRGYRFGDIFLIGDAAGLISGLTGKGMHAAIISAQQVAKEISGERFRVNLIEKWLRRKKRQEILLSMLESEMGRLIVYPVMFVLLKYVKYGDVRDIE
ncbi:MAG: ubiquinone biosynthesis hydroxylase family protein [bacterium ADurb.Bin212]|nr:MAG: ubiquinone biosynthesis hydroxylase family protein [bacterium ADurb.Bin212]